VKVRKDTRGDTASLQVAAQSLQDVVLVAVLDHMTEEDCDLMIVHLMPTEPALPKTIPHTLLVYAR
jgi:hypothetical protein